MSRREECSHSIDFARKVAGWCRESRDGDQELSMAFSCPLDKMTNALLHAIMTTVIGSSFIRLGPHSRQNMCKNPTCNDENRYKN